jgi:NitT/TauT family transport system ATP-binding protein
MMLHRDTDNAFLHVDRLTRSFGHIAVLQSIGLDVQAGEFLSIVGPSGCGKSTLLRIMAGLLPPSSGAVKVAGRSVTGPPRELTYIFQHYNRALYPWLSVLENVEFGLRYGWFRGERAPDRRKRSLDMLSAMGLREFAGSYPWQLSGGMQQRVALARALVCQPRMLLLDEPFSSVDAQTRASLQDLMLALWKEYNLTAVLVTHDIEEAIYMSTRIVTLSARPARVVEILDVDLPHPRNQLATRSAARFLALRNHVYVSLFGDPTTTVEPKAVQITG